MRRILAVFILICIVSATFFVNTTASDDINAFDYTVDGVEYTVIFNDNAIPLAKQRLIAEDIVGIGRDKVSVFAGRTCTTHNLVATESKTIVHKVRTVMPRCDQKIYQIVSCTECDYYTKTYIKTKQINCCPQD